MQLRLVTAPDRPRRADEAMPGRAAVARRIHALALVVVAGTIVALPTARPAVLAAPVPALVGPTPLSTGDFDGDGRDDLAVGIPREDINDKVDAGAVAVLYGSSDGLRSERNQLWTQASPGVPGALERDDGFGWATAAGDFDGDGYDDLAIGAPLESLFIEHNTVVLFGRCCTPDWRAYAGAVNVLYGGPNGLARARAQVWHQGKSGIKGKPENNDFFGAALATGDFNGDGRDELAVGVPGENKGAGAVQTLVGTPAGLSAKDDQLWLQDTSNVDDASERGDSFGAALAAGNLGYTSKEEDLAIGIPGEDIGTIADAGAVQILYGQPGTGLSAKSVPDLFMHQDGAGVDDVAEARDMFGAALAIGDFGRSAQDDLAVGVPGESLEVARQGAVQVFYGSSFGVAVEDEQLWRVGAGALKGEPQAAGELGRSLVATDLNGFSQDDLAIGSPYARVDGVAGAGAVNVVYGGPAGLTLTGSVAVPDQIWTRATLPNGVAPVGSDLFGFALAAGRFGRSPGGADLAVSAPNTTGGRGLVHVLARGGPSGLTTSNHQIWHQNTPGILDAAELGDRFGGG
jgi:hypothetical protein